MIVEVDGDTLERVASQIPRADTLEPGTRVVVRAKSRGWLAKVVGTREQGPNPVYGSALLVRGYLRIGAGDEGGRAATWGEVVR